jgi:hypothetical protein
MGHVEEDQAKGNTIEERRWLIKFSADASLKVSKAHIITLFYGDLLLATRDPYLVRVGSARVLIQSNSICLISKRGQSIKIRNLSDQDINSTFVIVGDTWYPLSLGEEFVYAANSQELSRSVIEDKTNRRQLKMIDIPGGESILRCDCSIVSVMSRTSIIRDLQDSKVLADRQLFERLLKVAACLSIVTSSHGNYMPITQAE